MAIIISIMVAAGVNLQRLPKLPRWIELTGNEIRPAQYPENSMEFHNVDANTLTKALFQ